MMLLAGYITIFPGCTSLHTHPQEIMIKISFKFYICQYYSATYSLVLSSAGFSTLAAHWNHSGETFMQ